MPTRRPMRSSGRRDHGAVRGTWGSWSPQSHAAGPTSSRARSTTRSTSTSSAATTATTHGDRRTRRRSTTRIDVVPLPLVAACPSRHLSSGQARPGNNYFASVGSSLHCSRRLATAARRHSPNGVFHVTSAGAGDRHRATSPTARRNTIAFGEWRIGDFNERQAVDPPGRDQPPAVSAGRRHGWGDAMHEHARRGRRVPARGSTLRRRRAGLDPGGEPWRTNMSYLGQAWNQGMFGWTLGQHPAGAEPAATPTADLQPGTATGTAPACTA